MRQALQKIEYAFQFFCFGILALNICLISIPRCEFIISALQHELWGDHEENGFICGGQVVSEDAKKGPVLKADSACRCKVFKFIPYEVKDFDIEAYSRFLPTLLRILSFADISALKSIYSSIDPPYPRST